MSTSQAVNYTSFVKYMAKYIIDKMQKESWMPDKYLFSSQTYMVSALNNLFSVSENSRGKALSVRSAMTMCVKFLQYTGKIYDWEASNKINNIKNPTKILSVKTAKEIVKNALGSYTFYYVYSDNIGDLGHYKTYAILPEKGSSSISCALIGGGGGGGGNIVSGGGKDCEFECESTAKTGGTSKITIYTKSGSPDLNRSIESEGGTGAIVWHKHSGSGSSSVDWKATEDANTKVTKATSSTWAYSYITLSSGEKIYVYRGNGGDGGGGIAAVKSGKPAKITTGYHGKITQDYNEKLFAGGGGGGGWNGAEGVSYLYPANEVEIHYGENGNKTVKDSMGGHGENVYERVGVYAYGGEGGWANYDDESRYGGGGGGGLGGYGGSGGSSRKTDSYSWASGGGGGGSGVIYGTIYYSNSICPTLFIR